MREADDEGESALRGLPRPQTPSDGFDSTP
jgi:hypothetical protein